ncbi:MAG: hypothetical protein IIA45_06645 [Bacteroidetes bacterium]|nr:hypothetical protein [Bacteroidota bacterium]
MIVILFGKGMGLIRKHTLLIAGAIIGGVGGLLYWKYVGCVSGHCAIWSSSGLSAFYGIFLGSIGGWSIKDAIAIHKEKKNKPPDEER